MSLSARRAWIEIDFDKWQVSLDGVALRKESVDRNRTPHHMNTRPIPSLSARRAWIEIRGIDCKTAETVVALRKESVDRNIPPIPTNQTSSVALRKESVDRNNAMQIVIIVMHGRSPQGERG